jgi:hypothetical protein
MLTSTSDLVLLGLAATNRPEPQHCNVHDFTAFVPRQILAEAHTFDGSSLANAASSPEFEVL